METGLPVAYYTDGQKIPGDLHHAEAVPLVRLAVERLKVLQQKAAAERLPGAERPREMA
jgi:flagellar biosynthesis protein FlhF